MERFKKWMGKKGENNRRPLRMGNKWFAANGHNTGTDLITLIGHFVGVAFFSQSHFFCCCFSKIAIGPTGSLFSPFVWRCVYFVHLNQETNWAVQVECGEIIVKICALSYLTPFFILYLSRFRSMCSFPCINIHVQYGAFNSYQSRQFGTNISHMQFGIESREQYFKSRSRTIQVAIKLIKIPFDDFYLNTSEQRTHTHTQTHAQTMQRHIYSFRFSKLLLILNYKLNYFARVLMLGDTAVGKSSLVSQFMTSEYLHAYDTSIGELKRWLVLFLDYYYLFFRVFIELWWNSGKRFICICQF